MNNYSQIGNVGPYSSPVNDPLTYCAVNNLDQLFMHGGNAYQYGPYSRPCQLFMSERCANKWDSFCEIASKDTNTSFPNNTLRCDTQHCPNMSAGDILLYNTARRKYLTKMHNGVKRYMPFDPTVANSYMISYWESADGCYYSGNSNMIPEYSVDYRTIDNDPVMNKILLKPHIAIDILKNIYNTMKRKGTVKYLKGTKIGNFFNSHHYFVQKGGV